MPSPCGLNIAGDKQSLWALVIPGVSSAERLKALFICAQLMVGKSAPMRILVKIYFPEGIIGQGNRRSLRRLRDQLRFLE